MDAGIPILGSVNNSNDLKELVNNEKAGLVTVIMAMMKGL